MKKISCFLVFAIAIIVKTVIASPIALPVSEPRAVFDRIWVDYDITQDGMRGMRIHLKFTTYEMKGMDAYVAIYYLYDDERGGSLKDKNKNYYSTTGDVALYKSITPSYEPALYSDLQMFMPYEELDLAAGIYNLTMDIKIIYKQGGTISNLTKYNFKYTEPESNTISPTKPDAKIDDLHIDYDVTDNGRKGMRIHVKFTVYNMKDTKCYLAAYFEKANGDIVYGVTNEFRSKSGQLAVFKSLTPAYKEALYNDAILFLPYSEMNLGTGRVDLKLDADIIYANGDLLKHLKYHEFWFEQ